MKLSPLISDRINSRFCRSRQGSFRVPGRSVVILPQASPSLRERDKRSPPPSGKRTPLFDGKPAPVPSPMQHEQPRTDGSSFCAGRFSNVIKKSISSCRQRLFEASNEKHRAPVDAKRHPPAGSFRSLLKYGFINIFKVKTLHGGRHEKIASEGTGK